LPAREKARVAGESLPPEWPIPIIAVSVLAVLFAALAIWRFGREEFKDPSSTAQRSMSTKIQGGFFK
jgi:hypothetical protein